MMPVPDGYIASVGTVCIAKPSGGRDNGAKANYGRATKCGPSAMSAITGKPTHECAAILRDVMQIRGDQRRMARSVGRGV